MRWFCVHPALPDNATLRVRSYPSSDAPELGRRVPKGRAIAVVAPEFEVVAASEAEVHRWVRVVAPDGDTGEERDGFMMASLPDGTDLLTSWHKAGFRSCCRVENPKAFLFDGPTAAADVVGLVESIDLPYGILEVKGSRALIQHAEHEHVWIDTKELDPVCLPLHHSGCSGTSLLYSERYVLRLNILSNYGLTLMFAARSCAFLLHSERGIAARGADRDSHVPVQRSRHGGAAQPRRHS